LPGTLSNAKEAENVKIKERLLECKVKMGIKSDYRLAEVLGTSRQRISELMNGKCKPDAYIAVRIAELLKVHPLMLVAEFEADTAKDETKKAFWVNFGQRIKTGAVAMLVLISTAFWSPEPKAEPAVPEVRIMYIMSNAIYGNIWLGSLLPWVLDGGHMV